MAYHALDQRWPDKLDLAALSACDVIIPPPHRTWNSFHGKAKCRKLMKSQIPRQGAGETKMIRVILIKAC